MSTPYRRPTAVSTSTSTNYRPDSAFVDQLWSALHLDDLAPRTPHSGLPVARLKRPERGNSTYYTVTAIDVWGRLADRSPLLALDWQPGLSIAMSVTQGAVVVVSRRDGRHTITRQGHLRLPASVRHVCRLKAGDRLLLAACPDRDLLIAYSMSALNAMVFSYHAASSGTSWQ